MVPKISDDPDVRMCISGFLAEGSSNDVRVIKELNSNTLAGLYDSASPSILLKPFRSSLYPEVGKFKSPTGLLTSRNTALFHDPNALDTLLCEGESMWVTNHFSTCRQSGVCIQFRRDIFDEQTFDSVLKPTLSLLTPYLCSFNLAFWNSIFPYSLVMSTQ